MKKIILKIACLFALMLPICGAAQGYYTLPELREQAKEGWHETYTDKYGRTTVVDIDTPVYGEDQAPILEIVIPGKDSDEEQIIVDVNNPFDSLGHAYDLGGRGAHLYHVYGEEIELDKIYAEEYGTQITVQQAYEKMFQMLEEQGFAPETFFYDRPQEFDVLCSIHHKTGEIIVSPFYLMRFWQKMHEMPIFTQAMMTFQKQRWPMYYPYLYFEIRNENECSICITPMQERAVVVEDIPLCSFDKVIEGLEKEIESGHIQKVYDLQFGYAIYTDPDSTSTTGAADDEDCFYAVPSWVMNCVYMVNPKETFHFSYEEELAKGNTDPDERKKIGPETITINAQTGKMLDPLDRSHGGYGDARYKGFISWDEVR